MWTGQCQVSRSPVWCKTHVYRGKKKNPATESSLDSVTIQWREKKSCRHISLLSCVSLSYCQQWATCFSYFPEIVLVVQQGQQKKQNKKKKTFHCREHLVPKICKVLNQEVVLSQLHTESPLFQFWVRTAIKKFLICSVVKAQSLGCMCIQPAFPASQFWALKPLPGTPKLDRWTLGFPGAPSPPGLDL